MSPLFKTKYFWISTLLFLLVSVGISWLFVPSALSQLNAHRAEIANTEAAVDKMTNYIQAVKSLQDHEAEIDEIYEKAEQALPTQTAPEILLVQLDSFLKSNGITDATISVPVAGSTTAPVARSTSGSSNTATPGGSGSTPTPVITSNDSSAGIAFTLSMPTSFDQSREVFKNLRNFIRWNKIKTFSIATTTEKTTLTINAEVFTKAQPTASFSGNANFLKQAETLLANYRTYTELPDITSEGDFGRANPFAPAD